MLNIFPSKDMKEEEEEEPTDNRHVINDRTVPIAKRKIIEKVQHHSERESFLLLKGRMAILH